MLCIRSIVHYINIYSRIVIQLNMYVKIITSSGFKSTILTDFVQGQLRVPFRFGRCLPEVHLFTGSCRLLRRLFDYARGSTQMEKKRKKKKIGAEFMTSVSYRPEVIRYGRRATYESIKYGRIWSGKSSTQVWQSLSHYATLERH